jgi:hypothetical protein
VAWYRTRSNGLITGLSGWTDCLSEKLDEKIPLEFFDALIAGTGTLQQMAQRQ